MVRAERLERESAFFEDFARSRDIAVVVLEEVAFKVVDSGCFFRRFPEFQLTEFFRDEFGSVHDFAFEFDAERREVIFHRIVGGGVASRPELLRRTP